MPEHRIHITISGHGRLPANGERFLEGFMSTHPEVGPVVSQNVIDGRMGVTFSLDAADASDAFERARPVFDAGLAASGLERTPIVNLEISLVPANEYGSIEASEPALV